MRRICLALTLILTASLATAGDLAPRPGWSVVPTDKSHADLLADLKTAIKANGMGVVTQAGPTATARARGITIPENRVVGAFNNDTAVRILALSTAAMIEAPIRFYVTENADATATLSYKLPSKVFAPYMTEAGPDLATIAASLDTTFATISTQATQ